MPTTRPRSTPRGPLAILPKPRVSGLQKLGHGFDLRALGGADRLGEALTSAFSARFAARLAIAMA
jgi:hypothetical protein